MITLRDWARSLKRQTLTLYYATRDPRTPWYAKAVAALIVGYAISPIDLIPESVLAEARARAELSAERPTSRTAAVIILLLWVGATALFGLWAYQALT